MTVTHMDRIADWVRRTLQKKEGRTAERHKVESKILQKIRKGQPNTTPQRVTQYVNELLAQSNWVKSVAGEIMLVDGGQEPSSSDSQPAAPAKGPAARRAAAAAAAAAGGSGDGVDAAAGGATTRKRKGPTAAAAASGPRAGRQAEAAAEAAAAGAAAEQQPRKKRKQQAAAAAAEAAAGAAAEQQPRKKRKQQAAAAAAAAPSGSDDDGVAPAADAAADAAGAVAAAAAAGPQGAAAAAAKPKQPRKRKADGSAAAAAAAAAGGGGGGAATAAAGGSGKKRGRPRLEDGTWREDYNRTDLKHGAFDEEEAAEVQRYMTDFASPRGLPHQPGTCDWLLDLKANNITKSMLSEAIFKPCLPNRTQKAVWQFIHRKYPPYKWGPWTEEEDGVLRAQQAARGNKWKEIGVLLQRHAESVADRWSNISAGVTERRTGIWSAEEEEQLKTFVKAYKDTFAASMDTDTYLLSRGLLASNAEQPRTKGVLPMDDVDWAWVSQQIGVRTPKQCADKWYGSLAPSMLESGEWGPGQDRLLVEALSGAVLQGGQQEWEVDWDTLVPGRSLAQCKRRWRVLVKHLSPEARTSFRASIEAAAARFAKAAAASNGSSGSSGSGGGGGRAAGRQAAVPRQQQQQRARQPPREAGGEEGDQRSQPQQKQKQKQQQQPQPPPQQQKKQQQLPHQQRSAVAAAAVAATGAGAAAGGGARGGKRRAAAADDGSGGGAGAGKAQQKQQTQGGRPKKQKKGKPQGDH